MAAHQSGGKKSWSLNASARFARDARIATVAHLRDAEIARRWHARKMIRAWDVHMANFGDETSATVMLLGGLGYEPPYPPHWYAAADRLLSDEARFLAEADLYVLTPQMCDVVVAAALSLTAKDLELLDPDDLAGRAGLVVLPYPLLVTAVGGNLADDRAYAWHSPAFCSIPLQEGVDRRDAVHLAVFHDTAGPVRPPSFEQFAREAHEAGTPLPPLSLDGVRNVPFHASTDSDGVLEGLQRAARQVDGQRREGYALFGLDENRIDEERLDAEYVSGDPIDDVDDLFAVKFLYAFWRLCEQRITDLEPVPAGHAAGLAAQRAGVSPEVRVVRLRQAERERADGEPSGRQWQHRWVVRMHKVRQWYPSEQRHKVIYRGPYVKGPDDKPLLGGETVRGLVR